MQTVIVLGHSSSGKSPLGEEMERKLSRGRNRYHHLDFGARLRQIAAGTLDAGLSDEDTAYVRSVMDGQLLDEAHFAVARRIIESFARERAFDAAADVLVLNGFPRSRPQADWLGTIGARATAVVFLDCPAHVAWRRTEMAQQGAGFEDRAGRNDGSREICVARARSFERDTLPLVDYYRERGTPVIRIAVDERSDPLSMLGQLRGRLG
jgi:adenylate kinase family enzyme